MNEAPTAQFKAALLAEVGQLRFFALSFTGRPDRADDLVQETLIKAWAAADRFGPDTSIRAWLFTIMRNVVYSDYRKSRREVRDADGFQAARLVAHPEQEVDVGEQAFQRRRSHSGSAKSHVLTKGHRQGKTPCQRVHSGKAI